MSDLVLPAFELDCREWLVVSAGEAGLPEQADGAPMLAILSTVLIDHEIHEATGALSVGLLEDGDQLDTRRVAPGCAALELIDLDAPFGTRRFVMPSPNDSTLALVAEFVVLDDLGDALDRRVGALMASFRWQAD